MSIKLWARLLPISAALLGCQGAPISEGRTGIYPTTYPLVTHRGGRAAEVDLKLDNGDLTVLTSTDCKLTKVESTIDGAALAAGRAHFTAEKIAVYRQIGGLSPDPVDGPTLPPAENSDGCSGTPNDGDEVIVFLPLDQPGHNDYNHYRFPPDEKDPDVLAMLSYLKGLVPASTP